MTAVKRIAFPDNVWFFLNRVIKESGIGTSQVVVKAVMHALGIEDIHGTWRWETDYPPIREKIAAELADQLGGLTDEPSADNAIVQLTKTMKAVQHPREGWFVVCDTCGWSGKKHSTLEQAKEDLAHICQ